MGHDFQKFEHIVSSYLSVFPEENCKYPFWKLVVVFLV